MGSDGTSVDLGALTTFAHTMGTSADSLMGDLKGLGANMQTMGSECTSAPQFAEATTFHNYHMTILGSTSQFMNELMEGIAALGSAAEVAAINYADADDLNAFNLQKIQAAVKDGKPFGAMDVVFGKGQTANVTNGDLNTAFHPKDGNGLLSSPPDSDKDPGSKGGSDGKSDPTDSKAAEAEYNRRVTANESTVQNQDDSDKPQYQGSVTVGKGDDKYQTPDDATSDSDLYGDEPALHDAKKYS